MRWQDQERARPYVIASWFVCAATLPRRQSYDVFLIDNLHIGPVLMKRLFLRRDQKIVAHLASHTLYFLKAHRFSPAVERLHLWALRNYDALICSGAMATELVQDLLGGKSPPLYETFGGVPTARERILNAVSPNLESRRIVFIGSGPSEFRRYYKGLDLMVAAVALAATDDDEIEFDIVGEWDPATIEMLTAGLEQGVRRRIHFLGPVDDVADVFRRASLYLHCARGDAFPVATMEAMKSGVVPLVSAWTGTRQIVADRSARCIRDRTADHLVLRSRRRGAPALVTREPGSRRSVYRARSHAPL
jgi:glycosyltransferase involved in cell wall biosynthesis